MATSEMRTRDSVCSLAAQMGAGVLCVVHPYGCDPVALRSVDRLRSVFDAIVRDLGLHTVGDPRWHTFPGEGGVTGLVLLSESHLACHTYPERAFATIDLHCCRTGVTWAWESHLREALGAARVVVRTVPRGEHLPR